MTTTAPDPYASAPLYDRVDALDAGSQDRLIQMLDDQNRFRCNQSIKETMLDLIDIQPGDRILDVGSGTGVVTRKLARTALPGGEAVGIDASAGMVAEARRRMEHDRTPVSFMIGDAHALEFADASFDRVWSERTFIWLANPRRAMQELVRVTQPGGRIVVSTYDVASTLHAGYEPKLNMRLQSLKDSVMPSPAIGRELPVLFRETGLVDIVVRPHLVEHVATTQSQRLRWIAETRVAAGIQAGVLTSGEGERYLQSFDEAVELGIMIQVNIAFIVAGTKPLDLEQQTEIRRSS